MLKKSNSILSELENVFKDGIVDAQSGEVIRFSIIGKNRKKVPFQQFLNEAVEILKETSDKETDIGKNCITNVTPLVSRFFLGFPREQIQYAINGFVLCEFIHGMGYKIKTSRRPFNSKEKKVFIKGLKETLSELNEVMEKLSGNEEVDMKRILPYFLS